ncbi:crinkler (CRN) family protein [Thraustotheca clavata]|uniref:Crinkler (CRN) family protein n=1 Tax=Thraustotheca clavata TaxID=74557 RepID=A0A1V9YRW2_9STRA|nr:crinkler (CRN) family protein [Thraustotheca clavata]
MQKESKLIELRCGVYGDGTVFFVEVEHDARVQTLQEVIFDKKRFGQRHSFDATSLRLYLAKTTKNTWLKDDDDDIEDFLKGKVDPTFKNMRPSMKLNEQGLFGLNFKSEHDDDVHVLVQVDELTSENTQLTKMQQDISSLKDMLNDMRSTIEMGARGEKRKYSHSEMSSKILRALNVEIDAVKCNLIPEANNDVVMFEWSELNELQYSTQYLHYIEENIGLQTLNDLNLTGVKY